MRIHFVTLQGRIVETERGVRVGRARDLVVDIDSWQVVQIVVRSGWLRTRTYLVHRNQIVSVSEQKIIVHDSVLRAERPETGEALAADVEPVVMRESE